MKLGRYIPLDDYGDVKIGYGTIDHKNLKTIYIKINSWLSPNDDKIDFDKIVRGSQNKIKKHIREFGSTLFRPESIVDLDIRTKGIKKEKRSFMNLEVTLYVLEHFDVKSKPTKKLLNGLITGIIDKCLTDDLLFNFNRNKK